MKWYVARAILPTPVFHLDVLTAVPHLRQKNSPSLSSAPQVAHLL